MEHFLKNRNRILIGGHRGCVCSSFENTIPAMEEGIRRGADYLEIDLQLTEDGIIIVYHDVELSEKTLLSGYVHEHSLEEIREARPEINTFKEVLAWAKQREVCLALEIKSVPMDMQEANMVLAEQLVTMVNKMDMKHRIFAFGTDYKVLKHMKKLDAAFSIGLIVPFVPSDPVSLMKEMDALVYLSYIYNMTPDMIHQLHQAGYIVDGAILEDPKWIKRARESGVDMYESNYPEREKY